MDLTRLRPLFKSKHYANKCKWFGVGLIVIGLLSFKYILSDDANAEDFVQTPDENLSPTKLESKENVIFHDECNCPVQISSKPIADEVQLPIDDQVTCSQVRLIQIFVLSRYSKQNYF